MTNPLALIIEDDDQLCEIFSHALKLADFDTEIAQDGQAALALLDKVTPAMVLLDLHLPHVAGDEILRYIRASKRLEKVRVVLATADQIMAEALQDDVTLILLKPISVVQLKILASRIRPHVMTQL